MTVGASDHTPLRVEREPGLVVATIDHPPSNLVDGELLVALRALLDQMDAADDAHVLVLRSADPDFFLMHGDVAQLAAIPPGAQPVTTEPNAAAATFARLWSSRWVSIGLVDGIARGGGCELLSSVDLRIGTSRTVIAQPEVPLGIVPGAGGCVRLPHLVGRSRALEMILTARDVEAEEALAMGWLQALVEPGELDDRGLGLARRIAAMPAGSVAAVKSVLNAPDPATGLVAESDALARLLAGGAHVAPMRRFLEAGGQERDVEIDRMDDLVTAALGATP